MKNNINISIYNKSDFKYEIEELRKDGLFRLIPGDKKIEKLNIGETIDGNYKILFYSFHKESKINFGSFIYLKEMVTNSMNPTLDLIFLKKV